METELTKRDVEIIRPARTDKRGNTYRVVRYNGGELMLEGYSKSFGIWLCVGISDVIYFYELYFQ
jgi:hypothetical protein